MDRTYIELHLVVDRYLVGDLSEKELAEFEERLVWDQDLIDEVALAERLRAGLRRAAAKSPYVVPGTRAGIFRRIADRLATPPLAAAASFLLGIGLAALLMRVPTPDAGFAGGANGILTEIVPLIADRGAPDPSDVQTIDVEEDAWIVLLVDVTGAHESYRVSISRAGEAPDPVWRQAGLRPTYPDALAVGLPGAVLPPGDYVLRVEGVRDAAGGAYEQIRDIPFRLTLPE